jgi:tRNA(His) guanylyltransferase
MPSVSPLGARMKAYEAQTGTCLPSKSWAVLRLDGKSFHTYTKDLNQPFDYLFLVHMDSVTRFLMKKIPNAVFGYTQSDEISILMHNLGTEKNQHWFNGKVQKIVSVAASYAGAKFNVMRHQGDRIAEDDFGIFDARVSALPSVAEVKNYLLWRQQDALRNAVFMAASEYYSHKELMHKSAGAKVAMLAEAGKDWERDYPARVRFGGMTRKVATMLPVEYARKDTGEVLKTEALRTTVVTTAAIPFKLAFDSRAFNFLSPEELPCQPSEFLSLEHTPVSTSG